MSSKINIDGKEYDLKFIKDRSFVLQIIQEKMKEVDKDDYVTVKGDFEILE